MPWLMPKMIGDGGNTGNRIYAGRTRSRQRYAYGRYENCATNQRFLSDVFLDEHFELTIISNRSIIRKCAVAIRSLNSESVTDCNKIN